MDVRANGTGRGRCAFPPADASVAKEPGAEHYAHAHAHTSANGHTSANANTHTSAHSATDTGHSAGNHGTASSGLASLMGFYRARPKGPHEVVAQLRHSLQRYRGALAEGRDARHLARISSEMLRQMAALKALALQSEEDVAQGYYDVQMFLIREVYEGDLLGILCRDMDHFPFEARKDAVTVFTSLLRRTVPPNRAVVAEHVRDCRCDLLVLLLRGYDRPEHTLNYGLMLRECAKVDFLAEAILALDDFALLFTYIQQPTFDLSSDAFATFKDLLTKHRALTSAYLARHYERILPRINVLLGSENYVTRRQSLKLLGELLHDRRNYDVMLRYVSEVENLKLLMTQLRDKSEKIQFEAFQVFKIFIANPNKPRPVYDILCKNRDKILHFLESFTGGVGGGTRDDRSLMEDKMFLIEKLQQLPQYASASSLRAALASPAPAGHAPQCSESDSVPMATPAPGPCEPLKPEPLSPEPGAPPLHRRSHTPESLHDSASFLSAVSGASSVSSDSAAAPAP